ncbi:MAG: nucleotidyltransferase [Ruminococcaceae bacterium]|nr:nucleotidyltransferase [Oscillospiraceae bacterium]
MKKPILVIMAAGMGSRYGGLKQIDPVGQNGEIIMDYSVYDAMRAGFEKFVFIIKKENYQDFRAVIGEKLEKITEVHYAFQNLNDIPEGFEVPEGRIKPWGTGHAVLSAAEFIDAPFAVINADDFYGQHAFKEIYDFLVNAKDDEKKHFAMVGYRIMNTLSDNGHVARGVCETDENGMLKGICERTKIENHGGVAEFTEDDGKTWTSLAPDTTVSMNLWGFTESMIDALKEKFTAFFENDVPKNPLKAEYFLPFVVNDLLVENKADAKVLHSEDKWFGVTYREDKPVVMESIKKLTDEGVYKNPLWN